MTLGALIMCTALPVLNLSFGLASGDRELDANGYTRDRTTGDRWTVDERGVGNVLVRFGPFGEQVTFDTLLVFDGSIRVDAFPLPGPVQLPESTIFEHNLEYELARRVV